MCLSERNARMRAEASRTVCDNWAQVRNLGFAAQRPSAPILLTPMEFQAWAPGQAEDSK